MKKPIPTPETFLVGAINDLGDLLSDGLTGSTRGQANSATNSLDHASDTDSDCMDPTFVFSTACGLTKPVLERAVGTFPDPPAEEETLNRYLRGQV